MEVVVYSTLSSAPGQVTVVADQDQPIDSLISAFCIERGIRHQKDYILRNTKHEVLPNTRKIITCGVASGDIIYLGVKGDMGNRADKLPKEGIHVQTPAQDGRETQPQGTEKQPETEADEARSERWIGGCNQWWLLASIALLIGSAGLVSISILKVRSGIQPLDYGLVVDAGSSHSQVYVYKWEADKENGTAVPSQIYTCRGSGKGIADYSSNPSAAGQSLVTCMDSSQEKVPDTSYKKTPLTLGGTAGMRLLEEADHNASAAVMQSVRDTLGAYPFNFTAPEQQARILSGTEEGSFGWITVNYLTKKLGQFSLKAYLGLSSQPSRPGVLGAMDLGGASTQMTFLPEHPEETPAQYQTTLLLYGSTYKVYSHSYLCYGMAEGHRQYKAMLVKEQNYSHAIYDPCGPEGNTSISTFAEIFHPPCTKRHAMAFTPIDLPPTTMFSFIGTSNSTGCRVGLRAIFNFSCSGNQSCSFNNVYQPKVYGKYVAFSGFYYTTSFFNLTGSFPLDTYRNAVDNFCKKSWAEIVGLAEPEFLVSYCMEAIYLDILLTEGYKFDQDTWSNIEFLEKIGTNDLGWTLGYLLNASNTIPAEYPTQQISTVIFVILVFVFACFIAVAVGFALYAMSIKKDKAKSYEKLTNYGSV